VNPQGRVIFSTRDTDLYYPFARAVNPGSPITGFCLDYFSTGCDSLSKWTRHSRYSVPLIWFWKRRILPVFLGMVDGLSTRITRLQLTVIKIYNYRSKVLSTRVCARSVRQVLKICTFPQSIKPCGARKKMLSIDLLCSKSTVRQVHHPMCHFISDSHQWKMYDRIRRQVERF